LVIVKNLVGSAWVEKWQRGAVAADFHHVLDQTLDRLVFVQFSLKAFLKCFNYSLGQRLSVRWASARANRSASAFFMVSAIGHLDPSLSSYKWHNRLPVSIILLQARANAFFSLFSRRV
jgi:hypothetical protein